MTEMQKAADIQSVASSLAKHGGAFFSAVYGFMKDLIAAPGPYENQEPQKLVAIASATTLFTTSATHHGSHGVDKSDHPHQWERTMVFC